jgi:hypothetical protein
MRKYFILTFLLTIIILSSISIAATEFNVGVSPSTVDLGEIEKGASKIVEFFLVTPSSEPLLVYLTPERVTTDFLINSGYSNILPSYSEESVINWVEFLNNPVEIEPVNETLKIKSGEIRGWREINFIINVPKDSDPGYHMLKIKPQPFIPSESIGQTGARIVAITSVNVIFKISGDVKREGIILDVVSGNYVGNRLEINTYFRNTGTATISAQAFNKIYKGNESIISISSSTELVRPGEIKILKSFLSTDKLSGEYSAFTTVNYITNTTSKNSSITITAPPISAYVVKPKELPLWLIILSILIIVIIISILIYKLVR